MQSNGQTNDCSWFLMQVRWLLSTASLEPWISFAPIHNPQLHFHPALAVLNQRRGQLLWVRSQRLSASVLPTSSGRYRTRSYSHGNCIPVMLYQRSRWTKWAWWGCQLCRERQDWSAWLKTRLLSTQPSSRSSSRCSESSHHWKILWINLKQHTEAILKWAIGEEGWKVCHS